MASAHSSTDLEPLVAAASHGDAQAFSTLVDATSGLVTSIVLAVLRDFESSRDVAQDVFLSAWKDLPKLKNPASFLPWLRQIARNRSHHVLRSRVRARRHESADAALVQTVADARPGAETAFLAEEDRRLVADALDRLPDDSREVLLLFYREEQSVRQVATLLDLSEDAVKRRLSRARAVLRRDLLASVGTTLRRTAPGASFTAAVALAISVGAPPAAAAGAMLTASSAAKVGPLAKIAGAFSWCVIGPLASIALSVQGGRMAARGALDGEERRAWRLHTWTNVVLTSIIWGLFPVWWQVFPRPWGYVGPLIGFLALLFVMHHLWAPRILRRRHEAEMRADPERARLARAQERRTQMIGWTVGLFFGALGLAAALWKTYS